MGEDFTDEPTNPGIDDLREANLRQAEKIHRLESEVHRCHVIVSELQTDLAAQTSTNRKLRLEIADLEEKFAALAYQRDQVIEQVRGLQAIAGKNKRAAGLRKGSGK